MKPKRTATFLLIGAILGTWGTLTLSAVSEETTTTATIYSTTGAETYRYTGAGIRYDSEAEKITYTDTRGAKHTIYTHGYIVELTERG